MKTFTYCLFILALLSPRAYGQNIYGSSVVDIDPTTNTGTADCETDLDGAADDGYYGARVNCVVTDQNNALIASEQNFDDGDHNGYAEVVLTFTANPGSTYTATAAHSAVIVVPYDAPQGGQPLYFDEYNFENYIESPTQSLADSYDWYGPGPELQTNRRTLKLPPTVAKKHYPHATVSIAFIDPRNTQDALNFLIGRGECANSLGLKDCSSSTLWWRWNLEGSFLVSDDAANWTVVQTASPISQSGTDLDGQGNLRHFSVSIPMPNPDGPILAFLQATPGTTTGFWLDSPGTLSGVSPLGGSVLSEDWIDHFSVQVCSTTMSGVCATKSWNVHLVAAGGQLSASSSAVYE